MRLESAPRLWSDTRGALPAEYILAVGFVTLVALFALVRLGPVFVRNYELTRNAMLVPAP